MPDSEVGQLVNQFYTAGAAPGQSNTASSQPVPEASKEKASHTSAVSVTSSEHPGSERGSRPRPAKSCERCREKKLKCDRELPCNNCTKNGRDGKNCHYKTGPDGEIEMSWTMDGRRVNQREMRKNTKRKRSEDPVAAPPPSLPQVNPQGHLQELPQVPQQVSTQPVATVWDSQSKTFRDVPPQPSQYGPQRGPYDQYYPLGAPEGSYPPNGPPPSGHYYPPVPLPGFYAPPGAPYPPPPPSNYYPPPGSHYPLPSNGHYYPAPAMPYSSPSNLPSHLTPTSSTAPHEPHLSKPVGSTTPSKSGLADVDDQPCKLGKLHVMKTRSRYLGLGDRMAMMDLFEEPKKFIWSGFKDPEISSMMHELMAFGQTCNVKENKDAEILLTDDAMDAEMFQALPSKFLIGILTTKYIQNWETIYRVLHIPTFEKECNAILAIRDTQTGWPLPEDIGNWVVPQILMVLAISCRLFDPSKRGKIRERISDDQVTKYIQMVQKWLDRVQGRARADFHNLQTQTLLQIARQVDLTMPTVLWKHSGALVRTAMIMGLHFDCETSTEISKMNKEMRRRLWMTIVELDAHCSLSAGMPPALHSWALNPAGALNVEDEDLKEDMITYPEEKPRSTWTNALPQIALWNSIRDRLDAINWLGGGRYINKSVGLTNDAATILNFANVLEESLKALPPPFKPSTRQGIVASKRATRLFNNVMVDMSIRRPLFSLYRVVALSPHSARHPQARKGVLAQSLAILSYLDALDPGVADPNIIKDRAYLNLFHIICKHDIMQAALMICMEIWGLNQEKEHEDDGFMPQESLVQSKHSLTRVVENTLKSLIDRLGEIGSDTKDVVQLSVVLQSVRSNGNPEEKKALMIKGAERVLIKARELLPQIQDPQYQKTFRNRKRGGRGCWRGGPSGLVERAGGVTPAPSVPSAAATPAAESFESAPRFRPISFDEFNTLPDSEYDLGDFDFSSMGWDMGQSWL